MEGFGRTTTLNREYTPNFSATPQLEMAHALSRPTPLLSGKEGEEWRQKVWSAVIEALKKDVPGVTDALARLE